MKVHLVGCSHRSSSVDIRERLAFTPEQTVAALGALHDVYPGAEAVLLSTCNRVELYAAAQEAAGCPSHAQLIHFLADFHGLADDDVTDHLFEYSDVEAAQHLFAVAASLDSMVVGEAQILAQVKRAFASAQQQQMVGPVMHLVFEAAYRVAKRVATETGINRRRVSIPSVAVADFAKQLFETFHDKHVLLLGAGEMGEETLRYLRSEGSRKIVILNRSQAHAESLAARVEAEIDRWEQLDSRLAWADLVVSTTSAREPIVTVERFRGVYHRRAPRILFILDLAVPRDFEPGIGQFDNVYLYCIDDLKHACEQNRRAREEEWPKAQDIIQQETAQFVADVNHRITGPTILRLKQQAEGLKHDELSRLLARLGEIDPRMRDEIERSFERLVNKLLHPPLESLRNEASRGSPHRLLDALRHLFQITD
jgi:glutamyl-tRNA reductase